MVYAGWQLFGPRRFYRVPSVFRFGKIVSGFAIRVGRCDPNDSLVAIRPLQCQRGESPPSRVSEAPLTTIGAVRIERYIEAVHQVLEGGHSRYDGG